MSVRATRCTISKRVSLDRKNTRHFLSWGKILNSRKERSISNFSLTSPHSLSARSARVNVALTPRTNFFARISIVFRVDAFLLVVVVVVVSPSLDSYKRLSYLYKNGKKNVRVRLRGGDFSSSSSRRRSRCSSSRSSSRREGCTSSSSSSIERRRRYAIIIGNGETRGRFRRF